MSSNYWKHCGVCIKFGGVLSLVVTWYFLNLRLQLVKNIDIEMYHYLLHYSCSVKGCKTKGSNKKAKLYRFPKNPERYQLWANFSGNPKLQLRQKAAYICSLHFDRGQFRDDLHQILKYGAMPSINPGQISCEPNSAIIPSSAVADNKIGTEHKDVIPSYSTPFAALHLPVSSSFDSRPSCSALMCESTSSCYSSEPVSESLATPFSQDKNVLSVASAGNAPKKVFQVKRSLVCTQIDMSSIKGMTPRKKEFTKFTNERENVQELKKKVHSQTLALKELNSQRSTEFLSKSTSLIAPKILTVQVRNVEQVPKYPRCTSSEILQAQGVNKCSPNDSFPTILNRIPLFPGINDHMFKTLSQTVDNLEELDRTCSLMFSEMTIREHVEFSSKLDRILGYEDKGILGVSNLVANCALVFMAQGLHQKWKQPLAFYFSRGPVRAEVLVEILKEVLKACTDAGLNVVATVCDMSTNNVKAVKALGSSIKKPVFSHGGKEIVTIFDPPHLLKCMRNNLMSYDVQLCEKIDEPMVLLTASWKDIQDAVKLDEPSPFRLLHSITQQHVEPKGASKMKIKLAAQVFSRKMAGAIYALVANGKTRRHAAIGTAGLCILFNNIFDSCNSVSREAGHPGNLRCPIDINRENLHLRFWDEAIAKVQSLQFLKRSTDIQDTAGSSTLQHTVFRPPSQDGWIASLNGMKILWCKLKEKGFTFLETRYLNQDSIDHLFSCIRFCASNDNPTVVQFVTGLKTAMVNDLAFRDLKELNCELEEDFGELLNNLHSFIYAEPEYSHDKEPSPVLHQNPTNYNLLLDVVDSFSIAKVSGFIASRFLRHRHCSNCRIALLSDIAEWPLGIYFQEYCEGAKVQTYPSNSLCRAVALGITLVEDMLNSSSHLPSVKIRAIKVVNENVSFDWIGAVCVDHAVPMKIGIVELLTQNAIHWWCKRVNRTLADKARHRATNDT